MIVGLGIDLVATARIEKLLGRYPERFADKVFTAAERAYCGARARPAEHYGARFAAKEAVLKALGVPLGLSWHDMEVSGGGAPVLTLSGAAARAAAGLGATRWHVSLTHGDGYASAVVVMEGA